MLETSTRPSLFYSVSFSALSRPFHHPSQPPLLKFPHWDTSDKTIKRENRPQKNTKKMGKSLQKEKIADLENAPANGNDDDETSTKYKPKAQRGPFSPFYSSLQHKFNTFINNDHNKLTAMTMLKNTKIRQTIIITLSALIGLVLLFRLFAGGKGSQLSTESTYEGGGSGREGSNNLFGLKLNDQMELSQKLDELADKLLEQQEKRLSQLEEDKIRLERQLNEMKKPSEDLSLREKLAFVYPYDQNQKFPAYVWQTWKYGLNDDRFGREYKQGEEQWAYKNPGFVHELFNDDTSRAIIRYLYRSIPEIVKVYDSLPHVILRADFFRYLILFAKGGVYADVDTLPLQPIPNWIPENVDPSELGMIIGIESDPVDKNWRKYYTRRLQFANWVLQAKPGHPILREIIASITELSLDKMKRNENTVRGENEDQFILDVMNWTGDGQFTDVIFRYFNDYVLSGIYSKVTWKDFTKMEVPKLVSDVLVLPVNSFGSGEKELDETPENVVGGGVGDDHPLAFVKHYKHQVFKQEQVFV